MRKSWQYAGPWLVALGVVGSGCASTDNVPAASSQSAALSGDDGDGRAGDYGRKRAKYQPNDRSNGGSVSADGRYVVFTSLATNVVHGIDHTVSNVFLRDRVLGTVELISQSTDGVQGNRDSFGGSVSQDGRWVAFTSESFNLVPNDTNGAYDVFIRDRLRGTTEMVSVNDHGVQGNAMSFRCAISADGNSVSFSSGATNLVDDDTNGQWDVFVHDVAAHRTERVSVGNGGAQGLLPSMFSALSADGRYCSFMSFANNFVAGDTNNQSDVFVRDRLLGTTERVNVSTSGAEANNTTLGWAMSADGRYVSFGSLATTLVPGVTNHTANVYVHDRTLGTTELVNVANDGSQANALSYFLPLVSGDGRYIAYASLATNLVPGVTSGHWNMFLRDRHSGVTSLLSTTPAGVEPDGDSGPDSIGPGMNYDGSVVVYTSAADDVVAGDANNRMDVFAADSAQGTTELVSLADERIGDFAAPRTIDPSSFVVLQSYAGGQVLAAAPSVTDKSSLLLDGPPHDIPISGREALSLNYNSWMHASGSADIDPSGGQGHPDTITAYAQAYLKVPFFGRTSSEFTNQTTYVAWLGQQPFNADKIIQTDSWLVEVPPFTPTPTVVNAPPGSTVQPSNSNVLWQTEVDDNWFSEHTWNSIKFLTPLLFRSNLGVSGTFQFGSTFFVTAATDSST